MTKDKATEVASAYFPSYPKVNAFHITSDGMVFENETHADNHARTMKDDKVHKIERPQSDESEDDEEKNLDADGSEEK